VHGGLPNIPAVYEDVNFDLYQVDSWKLELTAEERQNLQRILDGAAEFHQRMYQTHRSLDQTQRDKMVVIAGVGFQTLFRLAYEPGFFGLWERAGKIVHRISNDPDREGDGRVPLASAMLENEMRRPGSRSKSARAEHRACRVSAGAYRRATVPPHVPSDQ
jgi:hypothetical protein